MYSQGVLTIKVVRAGHEDSTSIGTCLVTVSPPPTAQGQLKTRLLCPHHLSECKKVQTTLITACSDLQHVCDEVSPPPPSRTATASTLTEWQMALTGFHHFPKMFCVQFNTCPFAVHFSVGKLKFEVFAHFG